MKANPSKKHQEISTRNNSQISHSHNFKSKDTSKLIGKKRKRGKNVFNEKGEESNETNTTGETFHRIVYNELKEIEENEPSILNEERGIIESLPLIRKHLCPIPNKKEKFIKINNTNIKQGSFINQSKRRNPRKRWRKKNKKYFFKNNTSRENLNNRFTINSVVKKFVIQKIKENAKKIDKKFSKEITGLKMKEAKQRKEITGLKKKEAKQRKEITGLKKKEAEQDKKIKNQNNKIGLLLSIYNHSDIYTQKIEEYVLKLGLKFNKLINSFKVLYTRKICNFILDGIINRYGKFLALTTYDFYTERNNFKLIVFKKNVNHISKYYLNLIIDFLMETKQNTSNIIHIHKDDIPIMKEIFFLLFNKEKNINENENYQLDINIQEMADFILSDSNIENEKQEETSEKQEEQSEENEEPKNEGIKAKNEHINRNNYIDNEFYYFENYIKKNKHTKELILNKNNNDNISIKFLSQVLEKKVKKNKKGIKNFFLKEDSGFNQSYFYNLWIESFEKEEYKRTEEYETFIKTEFIQSSIKMKELIIEILPDYQIKLFSDDTSKFTKRIKEEISGY